MSDESTTTEETEGPTPEAEATNEAEVVADESVTEDAPAVAEPEAQASDDAPVAPEAVEPAVAEEGEEAPAAEEAEEAPATAHRTARVARVYFCDRGHRTTSLWSEPTLCKARPARSGPECGRPLYEHGQLPETVVKALNPLKASKKSAKKG